MLMEAEDSMFFAPINPNNFPAKLWRLVNDPLCRAAWWDASGEGIIIDQPLLEAKLLGTSKKEGYDLFKTKNFTSFIRQLNLYGFRKLLLGSDGEAKPGGGGESSLHHFCNAHFRRDHPELLANIRRLTSVNKARMKAGLKVHCRPPNRLQRLLTQSLGDQEKGEDPAPTIEDCASGRKNISPYPCISPVVQNHTTFPLNEFDHASVSPKTWLNPLGLHQGPAGAPSSIPQNSIFFPAMSQFPTDVTYTVQSSATSVHVQQTHSVLRGSMHNFGGYVPPTAQYPAVYYPATVIQYYPSPYMEHLAGLPIPAVSSYEPYTHYQRPPIQSILPTEIFQPNLTYSTYDELKKDKFNLDAVAQYVDELQPPTQVEIEMARLDTREDQESSSSSNNHHTPVTLDQNQTDQLQCLLPVNIGIAPIGYDLSVASKQPQASNCCYSPASSHKETNNNTLGKTDLLVSDNPYAMKMANDGELTVRTDVEDLEGPLDVSLIIDLDCEQTHFPEVAD